MANAFINDTYLTDMADSIRAKLMTDRTYLPSEMADAIDSMTGALEEKDVNFYDYEGTVVASYTKEEALELEELPQLPDRTAENLFNEGWNLSLEDIHERIDKGMHYVSVGCLYRTLDNKTHFVVCPNGKLPTIYITISASAANDTVIDWGDGSAVTSVSTAYTAYSHTYDSQLFDSEIDVTIVSTSGVHRFNTYVGGSVTNNSNNRIRKVFMSGSARFVGANMFNKLITLEEVTIHKNITQDVGSVNQFTYWFYMCTSLRHLNLPNIAVGRAVLGYSSSIRRASIPRMQSGYRSFMNCLSLDKCETLFDKGVTTDTDSATTSADYMFSYTNVKKAYIDERVTVAAIAFNYCYSLEEAVLPSTITAIDYKIVSNCPSLKKLYIKAETVPTLNGQLTEPNNFYTIYVPRASYNDYIAATNWSNIASHIQPYDFDVSQHALNLTMPNGGTVTLTKSGTPTEVVLEYSTDNGHNWTTWVEENNARTLTLAAGQTMHVRNTSAAQTGFSTGSGNTYIFSANRELWAGGDIRSLLCKTPENVSVLGDNCFLNLFYQCGNLKSTPLLKGDVIGASSLMRTFRVCTGLVLVRSFDYTSQTGFAACRGMFQGCTLLETFPEIKVTKLGQRGLSETFNGCTKLKEIRTQMTDISATNALDVWVNGVSATGDFYCKPSLVIPTGTSGIPDGWTRHDI